MLPAPHLQAELESARNEQLSRVVAMVDALPRRGAVDDLIAPLRPRLAQLRPPRPMRLSRLLFIPLDPVIVPAPLWRPGLASVPRSVLTSVADAVLAQLGPLPAGTMTAIEHCALTDTESVLRFGQDLWPGASAALRTMPVPPDWTERTGLAAVHWPPLRDGIAGVLGLALAIDAAVRPSDSPAATIDVLTQAASMAAGPLALVLAVALARHPRPDMLLAATASLRRPALAAAAEHAVSAALDDCQQTVAQIATKDMASARDQTVQLAAFLDAAETPPRRARIHALRLEAQGACVAQLSRSLRDNVLAPLASMSQTDDAGMMQAEAAARDARRFELTARRLGAAPGLLNTLRDAASGLAGPGMGPVDRIRLTEILLGPEEAVRLG